MPEPAFDAADRSDPEAHSQSRSSRTSSLAVGILGGLGCYVGVFVALYLDAVILKTHIADRCIPVSWHFPVRAFFYPLLLIWHWLGWLPGPLPPLH